MARGIGRWLAGIAMVGAAPAAAQVGEGYAPPQDPRLPPETPADVPRLRFRVAAGGQLQSNFPGDDTVNIQPLFLLSRARGNDPFPFGAPGDGNGLTLLRVGRFELGPLARLEGRRRADDLGDGLPTVGRTVELGGFTQTYLTDNIRFRADVRHGIGGHEGLVSQIGADYVARRRDDWLWSIGPRVILTDGRYQRAWFGVDAPTAARTGLAPYRPGGGIQSVGATSRAFYAFTPRWGAVAQATVHRLIDDPARSPIVRERGSRTQFQVGAGVTYTFGID